MVLPRLACSERILSVDINGNCDLVAYGAEAGAVSLWDIGSGARVRVLSSDGFGANCVLFTANSFYVVAGYGNEVVRVWEARSEELFCAHSHDTDQA